MGGSVRVEGRIAPMIEVEGSSFEVITAARDDVTAPIVAETYLAQLAGGFGITPEATRGVLLRRIAVAERSSAEIRNVTLRSGLDPYLARVESPCCELFNESGHRT